MDATSKRNYATGLRAAADGVSNMCGELELAHAITQDQRVDLEHAERIIRGVAARLNRDAMLAGA